MTFRFKLTLWYSLILALLLLILGGILYFGLSRTLLDQIDRSLWFIAETEVASMLDSDTGEPHIHEVTPQAVSTEGLMDKYVQLLDNQGVVISKSANLQEEKLVFSKELLFSSLEGQVAFETVNYTEKGELRLIYLPITDDGKVNYVILVGTSLQPVKKILDSFLFQLPILGFGGLFLAGMGGWFLALRALKPVALITETAKAISSQSLHKRLDFNVTRDEIGQLIEVLNEMLDRLELSFASQKRFVSDASHELRSPLTVLKGTIEVLLRRKRTTKEYEDGLKSSLEEIDRLARLVNNLLVLARSDSGREKIAFQKIRLDQLMEEILAQAEILARENKVILQHDIQVAINYLGDPDKLRQLFLNLISNAVRYTSQGGWVKLSLQKIDNNIQISVADNGIGIPPKDLPFIFDRFYRVDRSRCRDETGGSGLGLAICRGIAGAHRGKIDVESHPGKGSTFIVLLPESC